MYDWARDTCYQSIWSSYTDFHMLYLLCLPVPHKYGRSQLDDISAAEFAILQFCVLPTRGELVISAWETIL